MPSTFTKSGVELIGDGEQSGTWGGTTNTNLQIIDRMVSQAGAIALSGTTHTLTISDGILSDGQYGVLVFGGSPSGTNTVTISPNDAQRTYIVKNDSGENVVLSQGSGGNVTVADGKTAIIYCDGAGSGAAVVDLTADLAVTALALGDFGITADASELNILDGATLDTAELNILDGVTATTAELNILDGVTATTAELNILDGVTWTLTDYNTLTATAAELNLLGGVTGTLVTEAGAQTLTNKTLTAAVLQDGLTIDTETANWTGAVTLDPANGLLQEITLTGNVTAVTDNLVDGESVILHVDDGSAFTIAWPTITWISDDGSVPVLRTTGDTVITVWKVGTTLYGFASNGA
jgi:hypothetical protein